MFLKCVWVHFNCAVPVLGEYEYFVRYYKYKCNKNNLLKVALNFLMVELHFNENKDTLIFLALSGRYSKIAMA